METLADRSLKPAEFGWIPYVYCWTKESCSEDYPSPGPGWEFAGSRIEQGVKENDPPYRVTRWRRPEVPLTYGLDMSGAEDPWSSSSDTSEVSEFFEGSEKNACSAVSGRARALQLLGL